LFEWRGGRAVNDGAIGGEPGAVAGAVPAVFCVVEEDGAAEVGARR
jgi:hypothetical protein